MTDKRVALDQINIVVDDMQATVDFYRILGIEVPDALPAWQAHHRTADAGSEIDYDFDSTGFAPRWSQGWPAGHTGVVIGFRTATRDDVDALYKELTGAGHTGQQPPYDAFWGARYALVEAPSGHTVGLMSPVDPERRTAPPAPPA